MPIRGSQRPIHKYTKREWDAMNQEWRYTYPEEAVKPSMANDFDTDIDRNAFRWRGEQGHAVRKEQQFADTLGDMRATKDPGPEKPEPKKDKFLEGFEEGYKLAKEVDEEKTKKSMLVLRVTE